MSTPEQIAAHVSDYINPFERITHKLRNPLLAFLDQDEIDKLRSAQQYIPRFNYYHPQQFIRGAGNTTKQIQNIPQGCVYIVQRSSIMREHVKREAQKLNRTDIRVMTLRKLSYERPVEYITVDHSYLLNERQLEEINWKARAGMIMPWPAMIL